MSKDTGTTSFFEKLATFIVDKRNLIFFLYACALIFCLFSRNWVSVCNDITEYLPESTETRQGLTIMEQELTTYATARVMVSHVTYEMAEDLAEQMEQIEGVSSAAFGSSDVGADTEEDSEPETPEDIAEYFKGADALISVTFDGEEEDVVAGIAEREAAAFGNAEGLGEFDGLEGGGGKEVVGAAIDLGIVETLAQGFADVAVVEGAFVDAELDFLEPDAVPEVDAEGAPGGEVADVGAVGVEEVGAGTEGVV